MDGTRSRASRPGAQSHEPAAESSMDLRETIGLSLSCESREETCEETCEEKNGGEAREEEENGREETCEEKDCREETWEEKNVMEYERAHTRTVPACLNCTPDGFSPGPFMSTFFLCSANVDYHLADSLVFPFWLLGFDTPNKITALNVAVRVLVLWVMHEWRNYFLTVALLVFSQVLDCADGQMARR